MMAYNSEIEGVRATTYTYVNARAGAGSCAGRRNSAPRCLLRYIFSSFHSAKTLLMTLVLKILKINKKV